MHAHKEVAALHEQRVHVAAHLHHARALPCGHVPHPHRLVLGARKDLSQARDRSFLVCRPWMWCTVRSAILCRGHERAPHNSIPVREARIACSERGNRFPFHLCCTPGLLQHWLGLTEAANAGCASLALGAQYWPDPLCISRSEWRRPSLCAELLTCDDVGSYKRAVIRDSWPLSAGPTNSTSFGWSSKRCCGGRSYLLCILPP